MSRETNKIQKTFFFQVPSGGVEIPKRESHSERNEISCKDGVCYVKKKESSLTAPEDRDLSEENKFSFDEAPVLTESETKLACKDLVNNNLKHYPVLERRYQDPAIDLQHIGLISFIPAKGAKPNEKGIYGFAKLRGNYATKLEADNRAEFLIKNCDSYHAIYHTFVGRPFPLTNSSDYSAEINRVDLKQEIKQAQAEEVKKAREKEQKEISEVEEKEKELLEDVKREEEPTDDRYTTLRVKKAQLTWTYAETEKKMKQMCGLIAKARREIEELDEKHPELREVYYNKFVEARKRAGLSTKPDDTDQSFIRYMVEDLVIPAVDEEYNRIYGSGDEKK